MKLTKVACPCCGGSVEIDPSFKTARCPYCKGSFVIEELHDSKKESEKGVYQTKVIDVPPEAVSNELNLYSVFGWDFKHRKNHKVYNGMRTFKNGNTRETYADVVQITLQRDVKADWCSDELLKADDEFFKIREEYIKKGEELDRKQLFAKELTSVKYKPNKKAALSFLAGAVLFAIFLTTSIVAFNDGNNGLGFFLVALSLTSLLAGIVVDALILKKEKAYIQYLKDKKKVEFEKELNELRDAQATRMSRMKELLNYAAQQMEKKFGHKIVANLE